MYYRTINCEVPPPSPCMTQGEEGDGLLQQRRDRVGEAVACAI